MSGTGMSSNTRGLPYSCKRAAFISNLLSRGGFTIQVIGGPCLVTKCSDSGLCNRNVLFNRAGTCSNRTDDGSVQHDGYSAAEDDDLSRIAFLNAEERLSRLRESRGPRSFYRRFWLWPPCRWRGRCCRRARRPGVGRPLSDYRHRPRRRSKGCLSLRPWPRLLPTFALRLRA